MDAKLQLPLSLLTLGARSIAECRRLAFAFERARRLSGGGGCCGFASLIANRPNPSLAFGRLRALSSPPSASRGIGCKGAVALFLNTRENEQVSSHISAAELDRAEYRIEVNTGTENDSLHRF